jgi:aminoglycoside phosphotransferase (APT) family kinase protein
MHADEVDIDTDLVRRLLGSQFPEWADLPLERFASGGTVNAIYRVGEDLCVRLPLAERFAGDLEIEAAWLPRLAPHLPVAVPEVVAYGRAGGGYPFDWAVYRWIEGEPWRGERLRDLPEAARDLVAFIRALSGIDATGGRIAPPMWTAPLPRRDAWVRAAIAASADMIDADALTEAWERAVALPAYDGPPVWVHSDLLRGNVLVYRGNLCAVIDFATVHVGDPARDVIAVWTLLSTESRTLFREALGVDDATWERARGYAIGSVGAIPYYRHTNAAMVEGALVTVGEVLADLTADR